MEHSTRDQWGCTRVARSRERIGAMPGSSAGRSDSHETVSPITLEDVQAVHEKNGFDSSHWVTGGKWRFYVPSSAVPYRNIHKYV